MTRAAFPLRFRQEHLRALVREIAEREGISQNELLEQAAENEVIARGALLADDLERSLQQLRSATAAAHGALIERSVVEFAVGESNPDPLRARQLTTPEAGPGGGGSQVGAVAAFRASA